MPTHVLRLREVILRTGLSRSTIYERMSRGAFPRPIRLGERAVGWRDSDIEAWIARGPSRRSAARNPGGGSARGSSESELPELIEPPYLRGAAPSPGPENGDQSLVTASSRPTMAPPSMTNSVPVE